ncbi:MAG: hypothetical protein HXX08_09650 [Chloroflexi bacterium]|uniref:Uncharacterized protein n=1 Tax=Candidatus Chlorohelix allophototropha TaxID=3003348 RepID=A0A8T7M1W4_9CHLR|nr:hypothetical protein [Chloroflexota bacterium]WJW65508.1 hypothetical protein OZ401_001274 [Chloroflexota bacterium L227-S17]
MADFDLTTARPILIKELEHAGFDIINDEQEPNILQARRSHGKNIAVFLVDAGGYMRCTRTYASNPEQKTAHKGDYTFEVVRQEEIKLTTNHQLTTADLSNFQKLIKEMDEALDG